MTINVTGETISQKELEAYQNYALEKYGNALKELEINVGADEVELIYHLENPPFERVRRITGYLVGTMDKWNDAKKAEERDRVKHDV